MVPPTRLAPRERSHRRSLFLSTIITNNAITSRSTIVEVFLVPSGNVTVRLVPEVALSMLYAVTRCSGVASTTFVTVFVPVIVVTKFCSAFAASVSRVSRPCKS